MKFLPTIFLFIILFFSCKQEENSVIEEEIEFSIPEEIEFGINFALYDCVRDTVKKGDTFGLLMSKNKINATSVHKIVELSGDSIPVENIKIGNPYVLLRSKDASKKLKKFIYKQNNINYYVIDFTDSIAVYKKQKPITIKRRIVVSNIESSLSETINKAGIDYSLAHDLSQIYAWSVDFFKLQKGDHFGVILNEKYINDTLYAGIDNIEATFFNYKGKTIYAFPFVQDSSRMKIEYYDENAKALRSMFLKAPLKFSRISSRFTPKRFHPVQKIWKAHKGTDYAAATGTDIMTTASGVVIKAGYNPGNGNYVKVKHDQTYTTQYLHMSKIIAKKGQYVKQGDVIGKVGSTGLSTGPHVCYRFWKNGIQVDPLVQKIQNSVPLDPKYKNDFLKRIKPLKIELDNLAKTKIK